EGIWWNDTQWTSLASYTGQTGHGNFNYMGYYSNSFMLHYAQKFVNTTDAGVFAWEFYANPSPTRWGDETNFLTTWNQPPPNNQYLNWMTFLAWGTVAPVDPAVAGWPL